jgi:hypothetical protein
MNDRFNKYKSKRGPVKVASKRMSRSKEWFARITVSQAEKLLKLRPVCWPLFAMLFFEGLLSRGKPFAMPDSILGATEGFSRANLHRTLCQLEECGLISIRRQAPKPPLIAIL